MSTFLAPTASNITEAAVRVLTTGSPLDKCILTRSYAQDWRSGTLQIVGRSHPPDRPARPEKPELRLPRDMPKRRSAGSLANRIALLHALAHIELNAVDLAWDIIARFASDSRSEIPLPKEFVDDWVQVADDEAKHFQMLSDRLSNLGAAYGDLPAHDGLWEASIATAHDLAARLAIVPMVLEARGLDVTPGMIASLHEAGDPESANILQIIHDEEISHVAAGRRWFGYLCEQQGINAETAWQDLVRRYFKGQLKRPFNDPSRIKADLPPSWYEPLADL